MTKILYASICNPGHIMFLTWSLTNESDIHRNNPDKPENCHKDSKA